MRVVMMELRKLVMKMLELVGHLVLGMRFLFLSLGLSRGRRRRKTLDEFR